LLESDSTTTEKITKVVCLESHYKYSFKISDSFGDGICCVEGQGLYVLRVDDIAIVEGGDFKKSEKFWFKFQNCVDDGDCDDGDVSTTSLCVNEVATCVYFPKACHEYGRMVDINTTTYNFPESAIWIIEDEKEVIKYEGGPYELSKTTFSHDVCLPDGIYKLKNIGSDLIGCRLAIGNDDKLMINEEYLQSGQTNTFTVGNPPTKPTPSLMPSMTPSIAYNPIKSRSSCKFMQKMMVLLQCKLQCDAVTLHESDCIPQKRMSKNNEDNLLIEYKTDWSSQETIIYIDKRRENRRAISRFKNVKKFENFPLGILLTYSIRLRKNACHRFRIYRKKGEGLGKRWYKLFWEGEEVKHDPFTTGAKQIVLFGNCTI